MDTKFLQTMYQQWIDGQTDPAARWLDFIELACHTTRVSQDELMRELQKTRWFRWRREE